MALNKIKLGSCIELSDKINIEGKYGEDSVVGISTQKRIIATKADLSGVDLSSYKIFAPGQFAYVPDTSRRKDKVSLAYNKTAETYLVSSITVVFRVVDPERLLSDYLNLFFNRPEFDRYARFHSWGSARELFSWEDMCDIDIELPGISVQQKYVDIYNAMIANQQSYERGLEDLKLVCDGYIEDLRRKIPSKKIGPFMRRSEKNLDEKINRVLGIGQSGFMKPQKNPNESLKNYKIIANGMIGYAPPLYNMLTGAIHYYDGKEPAVCSPIYEVFRCVDGLLPNYLILWLNAHVR